MLMYQLLKFSLICNPLLLVLCWVCQLAGFDLGSSSSRAFSCMQLKVQQGSFTSKMLCCEALYIKAALGCLTVDLKEFAAHEGYSCAQVGPGNLQKRMLQMNNLVIFFFVGNKCYEYDGVIRNVVPWKLRTLRTATCFPGIQHYLILCIFFILLFIRHTHLQ